MSSIKLTIAALAGTLIVTASVSAASKEHTNYLTFSAPIALPGVSLPAGTYLFEVPLEDSLEVVRVKSRDGRHVYFAAVTQTVERPADQAGDAKVVMGESPRGTPTPVKIWFPAGQPRGHAFVY